MPYLDIRDCRLYYEDTQTGAETILFSHGLLWSGKMFADQVSHLRPHYRIITYDHRGQGQSGVTSIGYDMDSLCDDAIALLQTLGIERCHFVGLSMGGFVGMRIAARYPDKLLSLTLIETSAQPEPVANVPRYNLLCALVRCFGTWIVKKQVMNIMFGQAFLTDPQRRPLRKYWQQQLILNRRSIVRAVRGVIERKGVEHELAAIKCPTLVIVGDQDVATTPDKARFIHEHIAHSQLLVLPRAGHSSSVEEPVAVNAAMEAFLASI